MHPVLRQFAILLGLSLSLFPPVTRADLLMHGFTVTYEVNRNGIYLGDTVRTFKQLPDNNWQYTSTTKAKGLASLFFSDTVRETSTLRQEGNRIIPLTYVYDQSGGKDVEHYEIDFLWDQHKIYNSREKKEYKIEGNAQDVQTFLIQIMRDLQNRQNTMTYFIASRSNTSSYVLTQNGSKKIDTPYKTLETIELASNKLNDNDQYRIWCAVSLEFMPVRVLKIDSDNNKIEFVIRELKTQ
ncbi:MAG: DUF3108 domain-containing protein [Gammaproteobacteria bacterium]|nr:DUF3108 domain-containing protein [Gammaproteobacteria bacterium]